jgi:hypothetical protein
MYATVDAPTQLENLRTASGELSASSSAADRRPARAKLVDDLTFLAQAPCKAADSQTIELVRDRQTTDIVARSTHYQSSISAGATPIDHHVHQISLLVPKYDDNSDKNS